MYDFFRGKIEARTPAHVVLDVAGVGYRLEIPASTFDRIRDVPSGGEVKLLAYQVVREDGFRLFGFATEAERRLFTHLLDIKGVGPAIALNVLSGSSIPDIVGAIKGGDARFLDRIKGVGKKTAERVILELREKADLILSSLAETAPATPGPRGSPTGPLVAAHEDALRAMRSLGYMEAVAKKAVDAALEALRAAAASDPKAGGVTVERIIKEALRHTG